MQRIPRLSFLLLITGTAVLHVPAQQTAQASPTAPSRLFTLLAPFIPRVSGARVTATYAIQVDQPLTGGGTEIVSSVTHVARDSKGRIRQELRQLVPAPIGEPPLVGVLIADPVSHMIETLDPVHHTDIKRQLKRSTQNYSASTGSQGEDLGSKVIDGLQAEGTRRTWISPLVSSSGRPVQVVDETWYSSELQLVVSEQQTNSSGRIVTIRLSHFDRREPSASLFKRPRGYYVNGQGPTLGNAWSVAAPDWDPGGPQGCCTGPPPPQFPFPEGR